MGHTSIQKDSQSKSEVTRTLLILLFEYQYLLLIKHFSLTLLSTLPEILFKEFFYNQTNAGITKMLVCLVHQ